MESDDLGLNPAVDFFEESFLFGGFETGRPVDEGYKLVILNHGPNSGAQENGSALSRIGSGAIRWCPLSAATAALTAFERHHILIGVMG